MAQKVKDLFAMHETLVRSWHQEGPLEKGMVTHSRILARRIPGTEESGGLQSMGSQKLDTTELVTLHSLERGGQVGRDRGRGWSRRLGPL